MIKRTSFRFIGQRLGRKTEGYEGDSFPKLGGGFGKRKVARAAEENLSNHHPLVSQLLSAESGGREPRIGPRFYRVGPAGKTVGGLAGRTVERGDPLVLPDSQIRATGRAGFGKRDPPGVGFAGTGRHAGVEERLFDGGSKAALLVSDRTELPGVAGAIRATREKRCSGGARGGGHRRVFGRAGIERAIERQQPAPGAQCAGVSIPRSVRETTGELFRFSQGKGSSPPAGLADA